MQNDDQHVIGEILRTLVAVIEEKDAFLRGHAERVAATCVNFARAMGLSPKTVESVYFAGLLHDIGMVYIPTEILHKTGPLNPDEMATMQQHPLVAEKILSNISILSDTLFIIRHHHEAWDGSGYPDGLKQDAIPLGARVLSLADQYQALVSVRPHRPAFTFEQSVEILSTQRARFDEKLFNEFLRFLQATNKADARGLAGNAGNRSVLDLAREIVEKIKKDEIEIPVLPKIFRDIQDTLDNPAASPEDLARVIEKDAVSAVRLIAAANSPLYRGNMPIRTVREAMPRLGIQEVKNVVFAIASKSLYQVENHLLKILFDKLWLHALACAYCAKTLAEKLNRKDPEEYFTIGLSHDIGKLMFLQFISDSDLVKKGENISDILPYLDEINASLSGVILRHWRLGKGLIRAVTFQDETVYDKFTPKATLILNVANHLADKIGYGIGNHPKELSTLKSVMLLDLQPELLVDIGEEVTAIMQSVAHTF